MLLDTAWSLEETREHVSSMRRRPTGRFEMLGQLGCSPSRPVDVRGDPVGRSEALKQLQLASLVQQRLGMVYGSSYETMHRCYDILLDLVSIQFSWASSYLARILQDLVHFEYFLYHFSFPLMSLSQGETFPYRDHVLHIAQVGAFGRWLMRNFEIFSGEPVRSSVERYLRNSSQAALFCRQMGIEAGDVSWSRVTRDAWWLAALVHDIGWPYVYFHQILSMTAGYYPRVFPDLIDLACAYDQVEGYLQTLGIDGPQISRDSIESLFRTVDASRVREGCDERSDGSYWHGLVAALELALLDAQEVALVRNGMHRFEYGLSCRFAAAASAAHDRQDIELDFTEEPISFLLRLCDVLQDWGRIIQVCCVEGNNPRRREVREVTLCPSARVNTSRVGELEFRLDYDVKAVPVGLSELPSLDEILEEKQSKLCSLRHRGFPLTIETSQEERPDELSSLVVLFRFPQ